MLIFCFERSECPRLHTHTIVIQLPEERLFIFPVLCVTQVPPSHPFLKSSELREDAGTAMGSMLALTASPVVSRSATSLCGSLCAVRACTYIHTCY